MPSPASGREMFHTFDIARDRHFIDSEDIGICDGCGDCEAPRRRVVAEGVLFGERVDLVEWLCATCIEPSAAT